MTRPNFTIIPWQERVKPAKLSLGSRAIYKLVKHPLGEQRYEGNLAQQSLKGSAYA